MLPLDAAIGPAATPFALLAVLVFYYRLFALPAVSSFKPKGAAAAAVGGGGGGGGGGERRILGARESAVHAAVLLALPAAFYVVRR